MMRREGVRMTGTRILSNGVMLIMALSSMMTSRLRAQSAPESFQITDLALDLKVDFAGKSLAGSATYRLKNWTTTPARRVSFILNRLMLASSVTDSLAAPLTFTQDVVRFTDDPMRQVTQVRVDLPRAIQPGQSTTLRIDYGGNLVGYTEIGWLYVRDRVDTAFTIIRQDALAFPDVGGINDAANRRLSRSDFTYTASVAVPSRYTVATGGVATRSVNANGTTTWRYASSGKSPFLNIAIAPYETIVANGIKLFYFPADSAGARRVMESTQSALRQLGEWFGPQRSELSLSIIEIPDDWGSQANLVGGIIQTAAAFRDPGRLGELYHELSHLWNTPDRDDPSPRWNEGLAMFMQDVLRERIDGWTGREERHTRLVSEIRKAVESDSTYRTVPFSNYGREAVTGRSYSVGRLMFATLYEIVGPARFNSIIREYYRAGGGTTREFASLADRAAGGGLAPFFNDWMFSTKWTTYIGSASTVRELAAPYRAPR
jgi:hypothetical protein